MSNRKKEKSRKKHSLIVLTGILFLLAAGFGVTHVWTLFHSDTIMLTPPVANYRAAREIYPYSVIPGGVIDAQEVADTIAHDAVARAHYAGIHVQRLWATRASEPMLAYVSYRKGGLCSLDNAPSSHRSGRAYIDRWDEPDPRPLWQPY